VSGPRQTPDWLTNTTYAHRGLHGAGVPENSLAAAKAAMAHGFGIECDIQRSRDGVAMVFHDWELERLTSDRGAVSALAAHQIEEARLLGTDQTPIRLARFLGAIDGQVPILIEIKSLPGYDVIPSCEAVARDLAGYAGLHAVMSFDARVPEWFARHSPATIRGLVGTDSLPNGFETVWREQAVLDRADADFLAVDHRDLALAEAQAWRMAGKPLLSWTIRTKAVRKRTLPLADALIAEGEAMA
jgi:glycerophosphoryl diester phosphodiesterase